MTDSALLRLSRTSFSQSPQLNSTQATADGIVSTFLEEAARGRTLAAVVVGGGLSSLARLGTSAVLTGRVAAPVVEVVAAGTSVFTEAAGFQFTDRAWRVGLEGADHSLLRLGGEQGLARGTAESVGTFGALRFAGWATRGQNIVMQHAAQSTAMVGAHHLTAIAGWSAAPEGGLAEQLAHAETMNLQVMFGMGALHQVAPGLGAFQRSLEISLEGQRNSVRRPSLDTLFNSFLPEMASEGVPGGVREARGREAENGPRWPSALMSKMDGEKTGLGSTTSPVSAEGRSSTDGLRSPSEARDTLREVLGRFVQTHGKERQANEGQDIRQFQDLVEHFREHPESLNDVMTGFREVAENGEVAQALAPVIRELQNPNRTAEQNARAARAVLNRMPLNPQTFMTLRHLVPNGITFAAAICAAVSVGLASHGRLDGAALMLPIAAILDKLDGGVARAMRASHPIGERLDSYADFAAYGMASAYFVRSVLESHGMSSMGNAAAAIIFSHAFLRLAVFDFLGEHSRVLPSHDQLGNPIRPERSDFVGMPSTMVGIYVPLLYALLGRNHPEAFYLGSALVGSAMFWPARFIKFGKLASSDADNPWRRNSTVGIVGGALGLSGVLAFLNGDPRMIGWGLLAGLGSYVASPLIERTTLALSRLRQRRRSSGDSSSDPSLPPPTGAEAPLPPSESPGGDSSGSSRDSEK